MANGQPSREEMMKLLGKPSAVPTVTQGISSGLKKRQRSNSSSAVDLLAAIKASQMPPLPVREDKGNPIFNIPILGPALDFIDTPRAAIVSGLKEFGDIFDDDESFSVSDWWEQTGDNIFMGEVLRDWGVDLPGPLDFALGLTLDIAFDPLTYMLPLGAWARMANKKRVIDNFLGAAQTAAKAKDFTKAVAMIKASERVSKGGIYKAGKEALEEIGLDTAVKFSIPLSGRLGQGIFERPLRMIPGLNAKWGKWMDVKRAKQLGQVNVGPGGKWAVDMLDTYPSELGFRLTRGFDIANPYNLKKVGDAVFRLNSANRSARRAMQAKLSRVKLGAAKGSPQFAEAVLTAARMPVEMGFRIPQGFGVLAAVAGVPGKVMGAAMQNGLISTIAEGLSTNFAINQMWRSGNVNDINRARHLEVFTARATNVAGRIQSKHLMELQSMGREADTLGIDFDVIFRGANETMGTPFAGAIDPILGPLPLGGDPQAHRLAQKLNQWFDDILEDYNTSLPHREDLEALKNELYVVRAIAFEEVELLGKGRWLGEGSGLTGSPFKNRELHLPDTLIEARKSGKFSPEEIERVEVLLGRNVDDTRVAGEVFDEALLAGKPVEVTAIDGQIYRSKFMNQGFLPEAKGGSVLTQMDKIGKETLGADYRTLFTTDSNQALNRYLEQMIGQIRGQKIVDDLAQHGIMFKSTDGGVVNAAGSKMVREINNQISKQSRALRKKIALEKKVVGYADTIANYNPEEALGVIQTVRAASRDAPPLQTGRRGRPRKVQPEVDLPTSYPPRSLEDIYQDLPKNQKGRAAIRAMLDDPVVAQYASNRSDLETTTEVISAIIRGDAEGVTAKGSLLLAQGAEALPHPSGRFSPNVRPLVPPEGSVREVRGKQLVDATEADIASAMEHIESVGREIKVLDDSVEQLRIAHTGAGSSDEMRAAYTVMQEHIMENKETLRAIVTNFTRNVLENVTSVQGAKFLDEFGNGAFGDVILFSTRKVSPTAERKLDIQNRWLNRLEGRAVDAKTIDIDVGSGGIPREWWEAYKAANPNWETTASVRPAISGNRVVLRDVGELQMERFQQFTDDWLAQKGGAPPPRKPAKKVGQEPPTWSGALTMHAENWPAQFVDDVQEMIEFELAHNRYLGGIKFSTGPRSGKGQQIRPTDGALHQHQGTEFTIKKVSNKEWRVVVDGEEIPISGPNARTTKAGEGGLVLWLPIQKRLVRFNPNPRQASMAADVTASTSKQALSVAKRIGKRIDDAAAKRVSNMAEADSLRDAALVKQEQRAALASAEVEKKVNVFEEYRLAQYGKRSTLIDGKVTPWVREAIPFAPKPVGRAQVASRKWFVVNKPPLEGDGFTFKNLPQRSGFLDEWGGRVVEEVEVRIPSRQAPPIAPPKVPLDRSSVTGQGVIRLKDGTFVVDSPMGRVRLTVEQAAVYDSARRAQEAAKKSILGERVGTQGRAQSVEIPATTEVKQVFAVNVYTNEMLVYASPPKTRQAQRYVEGGKLTGRPAGTKTVSNMNEPLLYVRPAPDDVRMASSREGGLWDVVDVRPGTGSGVGKFDPREAYKAGSGRIVRPGHSFLARMKTRGWVLLDDVDSVRALEDGTYVVPPIRAMRGATVKEQDAIEAIFNHPTYRLWIKRVQEAKRLEDELMVKSKLRYSERNSTKAAKNQAEMRLKQATQDVLEAKATGLEDQIAAGARTNVNNQAAIVALRKRAESLDALTEEGLQAIDEVNDHLATVVKPLMKAKAGVVEINEEALGIVNAHYVQEFKITQGMTLNREAALKQAEARGVASQMDLADTQQEALKILQGARNHAGLNSTYDELIEDYMSHASTLGKSAEKSQGTVSARTRQHLNGYRLVNAGDETVEMFEAAFQSAARLRDPDQFRIFGEKYGKLLNYWKAQAVATSGFVMRNQMGGTWINNQIAGVPVVTQIRVDRMRTLALQVAKENGRKGDVAWGAREIAKRKKGTDLGFGLGHTSQDEWSIFSMWADTGMANTGITSMEVKSAITEAGADFRETGTFKPWSREFYLFGAVGKFNQRAEFSLRGGLAHHIMMNGGSPEEALAAIYKYHFDYTNLTHWDQRIKQVIPFWTWQKNILPVLIESFGTRPQAWGRLVQVKGELELTSEAEGLVPDYFGENMGIRLPFSTGGNRVYTLPDLPFKDLARYLKEPTVGIPRGLVESALPFYKLPIEIWAGKRTFADIPFTGRYQQVPHSVRLLPGLMPFLAAVGKAKKNSKGEWKMRDRDIYIIEQSMPFIARVRRLIPNEKAKQERLITTYMSTFLGLGLRTNTPSQKRGQLAKDKIKHSQDMRDAMDILGRNV